MKILKKKLITVLISIGFWCILNESFSINRLIEGLFIALLCDIMISRIFIDVNDPFYENKISLFTFIKFIGMLFINIYKNAFVLAYMIIFGRPSPKIKRFKTKVRNRWGRCLLANAITLTPGTVTLDLTQDELTVIYMTKATDQGKLAHQILGDFEKILY